MIAEELTSSYKDIGMRCERDAFDTLFDHAPDKLQVTIISYFYIYIYYLSRSYMEKAHVAAAVVHFVVCVAAPNFWAFLRSFVRRRPNFWSFLHSFVRRRPN